MIENDKGNARTFASWTPSPSPPLRGRHGGGLGIVSADPTLILP